MESPKGAKLEGEAALSEPPRKARDGVTQRLLFSRSEIEKRSNSRIGRLRQRKRIARCSLFASHRTENGPEP